MIGGAGPRLRLKPFLCDGPPAGRELARDAFAKRKVRRGSRRTPDARRDSTGTASPINYIFQYLAKQTLLARPLGV
jgi:hypothetical protein